MRGTVSNYLINLPVAQVSAAVNILTLLKRIIKFILVITMQLLIGGGGQYVTQSN
jgi:hypothetical protein